MMVRRELLLIILLLVVIALLVKVAEYFGIGAAPSTEADASRFVLEELHNKYPLADIEILAITPHSSERGQYFEVKAKVTQNAATPCPERSHFYYYYPKQNFVPLPPEPITPVCAVCPASPCTLAFPEEAVIASHTLAGTDSIQAYLKSYPLAVPSVIEKTDTWEVKWDAKDASMYYLASIHRSGRVLGVASVSK